jgi:nicotinamidase-related amidase
MSLQAVLYPEDATMMNMPERNAFYQRITPDNAAVLFIDLQTGLMQSVRTIDHNLLRNNVVALAKIAILYDLPVVMTTCGSKGPNGPMMDELAVMFPDHQVIERTMINPLDDPLVVDAIRKSGRGKLIMCGVSTDASLAFAAISATAAGYAAYAVLDTSGTWSDLIEQGALARMAQAGVIPTNWTAVTAELQENLSRPTAAEMARILSESHGTYYAIDRYLEKGTQPPGEAKGQR